MRQVIVLALLVLAMPAAAQPVAGNLPPDFYPQPKCEKPKTPGKAPGVGDEQAMLSYNLRVREFNKQAQAFNICMKDYTDRAQADINTIQRIVRDAVSAANAQP